MRWSRGRGGPAATDRRCQRQLRQGRHGAQRGTGQPEHRGADDQKAGADERGDQKAGAPGHAEQAVVAAAEMGGREMSDDGCGDGEDQDLSQAPHRDGEAVHHRAGRDGDHGVATGRDCETEGEDPELSSKGARRRPISGCTAMTTMPLTLMTMP